MLRPCRNALVAALRRPARRAVPGRADLARTAYAAPSDWCATAASPPAAPPAACGEPGAVQRRVDTADHGHPERAAEQPGGVVDRGPDPGLAPRDGAHDRLGRGAEVRPMPSPYSTIWTAMMP